MALRLDHWGMRFPVIYRGKDRKLCYLVISESGPKSKAAGRFVAELHYWNFFLAGKLVGPGAKEKIIGMVENKTLMEKPALVTINKRGRLKKNSTLVWADNIPALCVMIGAMFGHALQGGNWKDGTFETEFSALIEHIRKETEK